MHRDIDRIIEQLSKVRPDISVSQLQVTHPADDDGIWFFRIGTSKHEVQLESSFGVFPFLVETDVDDSRNMANSVDEAIAFIVGFLDRR